MPQHRQRSNSSRWIAVVPIIYLSSSAGEISSKEIISALSDIGVFAFGRYSEFRLQYCRDFGIAVLSKSPLPDNEMNNLEGTTDEICQHQT
jgi:hypothetical protein